MLELDSNNRVALVALSALYKQSGNIARSNEFMQKYTKAKQNPLKAPELKDSKEEFEEAIRILGVDLETLEMVKVGGKFEKVQKSNGSLLHLTMESLMFIASGFQQKSGNKITVGDVIEILEDIMFVIFDLPYISSAIYYIMKYNYGTDDDLELMLDLLKLLLGYETHQNYEDIDEKILVEYERQKEISEIQDLESTSMAETQHRQSGYEDLFDIPFEYDTGDEYPGYFFVVDYEDEEKRKLMIRPKEKIIKSKKLQSYLHTLCLKWPSLSMKIKKDLPAWIYSDISMRDIGKFMMKKNKK